MTSSTTTIKAVTDGSTTADRPAHPRKDLAALRDNEARTLIGLACDAASTTSGVAYEIFTALYDREKKNPPAAQLQDQLCEALTCLQTTDHYLRMLGSVIDERAAIQDSTDQDGDPEDPGDPPF
jgi:hypothetical protein